MNRYEVFMKVIEKGSFTKAAEDLGFTQSAVSQMIRTLEEELSTTLISRSRKGIKLTPDGEQYLPYISQLHHSYRELREKNKEMQGLEKGIIRIGTFSSVSCHWLPSLIKQFKEKYPSVHFVLQQGDYTSIVQYINEGSVDFGFVNPEAAKGLETVALQEDQMLAVLPVEHPLANAPKVTLADLSEEEFILLEEGELSEPLEIFREHKIEPNIQYRVHDDYTIMSMVEHGLGISILPQLILNKINYDIITKEITPPIVRTIGIAYKNIQTLPSSSRFFIDFIIQQFNNSMNNE